MLGIVLKQKVNLFRIHVVDLFWQECQLYSNKFMEIQGYPPNANPQEIRP